jgi:hypothetical protein
MRETTNFFEINTLQNTCGKTVVDSGSIVPQANRMMHATGVVAVDTIPVHVRTIAE